MPLKRGTVYIKSKTATADTAFQVEPMGSEEGETILSAINIHCYTNPAYYGALTTQTAIIQPNAVVWFDGKIRVSDLWFKNYTAGSNTVIVITGIVA